MENLRHFLLPYTTTPFNKQSLVHVSYEKKSHSLPQKSIFILNNPAVDCLVAKTNYAVCQSVDYPYEMNDCLAFNNVSSIKFNYVSNYVDDAEKINEEKKYETSRLKIVKEVS